MPRVYTKAPLAERFSKYVDENGPIIRPELGQCHIWTGSRHGFGYGRIYVDGKMIVAHRVAFLLKHGRWPEPWALHKCDNPPCVRWDHLFEGDVRDNVRDMVQKGRASKSATRHAIEAAAAWRLGRSHCKHGHPFDQINTAYTPGGERVCRECGRIRAKEYARRVRASFDDIGLTSYGKERVRARYNVVRIRPST